jgi:acyl-CoA dehydrogenase
LADVAIGGDRRTEELAQLREAVAGLCRRYPAEYWRDQDRKGAYPTEFVTAMADAGWLGVLIPEEYGGAGLGITEASVVLEEVDRQGGNATSCHAQMYTMGTLLRHGSEEQKQRYLPEIAAGRLRLQAFGITEPDAGSETTRIRTSAVRDGDRYIVNGQKVFISRVEHSDLMLLLVRTTPYEDVEKKTDGLTTLLVDLREAGDSIRVRPLEMMINHHTTELFIDDLEVPAANRIGDEGKGFRYLLDGLNAERILVSAESIGRARWFTERASSYASNRVIFGKPLAANQAVQFPIAKAYANTEAADLMRFEAARLFDAGEPCGTQANLAKLLASEAAWEAANACLDAHGGYGFAVEYDVERIFRESRLARTAPINNNLVLAYLGSHVLGMPRSY